MLEPQMFTLCYYAAIKCLLCCYYAAINLSSYYSAVMLLLCCHYANIMLLLILKVYYAAIMLLLLFAGYDHHVFDRVSYTTPLLGSTTTCIHIDSRAATTGGWGTGVMPPPHFKI